ncbi:MOSC domain-containing protein [Thiohalocapsa halophila]
MMGRLRTWLQRLRRRPGAGRLEAILLADSAGAPMQAMDSTVAIAGRGLEGDRYAAGTGWWRATDGCQVTLIHAEHLARAARKSGLDVSDGRHRRNLVVSGLAGVELRGRQLRIGTALFAWHRVRPPCGYLDQVSGRGTAKALGKRAGICLTVIEGGRLNVHDPVHLKAKKGSEPFS